MDEILAKKDEWVSNIFITLSKIPKIKDFTFSHFGSTLQSLSLQNCEIVDVDINAFLGLNNLQKLSLNNNNISKVYARWFNAASNLKELDLSFNNIKTISASVFLNLVNLRILNLNNNQLSCLKPNELEPMKKLEKIRIDGNSFRFLCRGKVRILINCLVLLLLIMFSIIYREK